MFPLFLTLGAFGGFLSGLLGVGGAVIMIPLMLLTPPLFGFPALSMQEISGLSIVQVFFASISGLIRHHRNRSVNRTALLSVGLTMAAGTLIGVALSGIVPGEALLAAFGILALAAFVMMLVPLPAEKEPSTEGCKPVKIPLACTIGCTVGVLSGLVGAGGGFILIPLLIYLLGLPMHGAIGTSLGIVFIGSICGTIGKSVAGQVQWLPALALALSAVPASQLGAAVSRHVPAVVLRALLTAVILTSCIQTWWRIFAP